MLLPTEVTKASRKNPKRLIIYGKPKCGKTTALSKLPDTLILDMEDGTDHVDALKVKIIGLQPSSKEDKEDKKKRQEEGKFYLLEVSNQIKEYRAANNGEYPYQRIAVDTVTQLELWCEEYATMKYMNSVQGKGFNRDQSGNILPKNRWENVLSLPMGRGYLELRLAFADWLKIIDEMAPDIILVCHLKDKFIEKAGKEMTSADLNLTGKVAQLTAVTSDAIGYMYRKKNDTYLNFASQDDTCGARPEHLRGKNIILMSENDGVVETHWDEIYID